MCNTGRSLKGDARRITEIETIVVRRREEGALFNPDAPQAAPRSLVTFEAFKIYGGRVHAVEAIFEGMPANTPSGWR